jgi:hypothetical protein
MTRLKVGQQTERAGIRPTLSVMVARGIASEEMHNQLYCDIRKSYTDYDCNSPFNLILYHAIPITIPSPPRWEVLNLC